MLKRKTKTTAFITALCTMISMSSLIVNAANTSDTSWEGRNVFGRYNDQSPISDYCTDDSFNSYRAKYCYCREKKDFSSVYVYNKSSIDARVDVFAGSPMSCLMTTNAGVNYYDTSARSLPVSNILIPKRSERKIYQYIFENWHAGGGKYAHLHFKTSNTYGKWSPDCAYEWSYTRALTTLT